MQHSLELLHQDDYKFNNNKNNNSNNTSFQIWVGNWKVFVLFLNQIICCGYSKELLNCKSSFEYTKHMFQLKGKKILTILRYKFSYLDIWP